MPPETNSGPGVARIFAAFARIGVTSFGGGLVAYLRDALVDGRVGQVLAGPLRVVVLPRLVLSEENAAVLSSMLGTTYDSLLWIVIAPVFLVFFAFVGTAITHVCLMVVGGANRPFEATFRVYSYVGGAVALFNLIPCCGWCIGFVWAIVAEIIGLAEVHKIGRARAAVAVLLPILLCCGVFATMALAGWLAFGPAFLEMLKNPS